MTIAHVASTGTPAGSAQGTTSVSVAYVGTPAAGDLGLLFVEVKPETATFDAVAGWTLIDDNPRAAGDTFGLDTGPVRVGVFARELDGTETGSVTVTVTGGDATNGSMAGAMSTYSKTDDEWELTTFVEADDTGHDTTHSITFPGWGSALAAGDVVVIAYGLDTDSSSAAASPGYSQTGATFGTVTLRNASRSGSGHDSAVMSWDGSVSSGNANALTFSWTGNASCGPYLAIRLREQPTAGGGPVALDAEGNAAASAHGALDVSHPGVVSGGLAAVFDGINLPKLTVLMGFGGTGDPGPDYLHLGVGPGLGTGKLGGTTYVDVTPDITSISIRMGRDSDLDSAQPGVASLVADNRSGAYDPDNPSSPYAPIEEGAPVIVRAEWPLGTVYDLFTGEISEIVPDLGWDPTVTFTCGDGLETLGRAFLATTDRQFDGDYSGERIGHLADAAAWPTTKRQLDTGYTQLGPTTLGDHALPLMQKTEKTEFGLLWVDGSGNLIFYDRHRASTATRSTTVQARFTDTAGANEIEMTGLSVIKSRAGVATTAHVLRDPHPNAPVSFGEDNPTDEPVEQTYTNALAPANLQGLSFPDRVGELLRTDAEAAAMAQYLVDRFGISQLRIREVTAAAISQDRWAELLALRLLDRIEASRDYGPHTYQAELLVQGLSMEITDQPSWDWAFTTTNPPPAPELFVLGTSKLGVDPLGW